MSVPPWQWHHGVDKIKNVRLKTWSCLAPTPFVHNTIVPCLCFVSIYDFGQFTWLCLPSWLRFFAARWLWQCVQRAVFKTKTKHQRKHQRIIPACGHPYDACYKRFWKLCVCLYLHRHVRYKNEKAFGLLSEWYYTTRGLVHGYIITLRDGLVIMYPSTNLLRVMPLWSQAHAFALYYLFYILMSHGWWRNEQGYHKPWSLVLT